MDSSLTGTDLADNGTNELFPGLYRELRKLARARMAKEGQGHTLQTTALVHEVYLRMLRGNTKSWANRAHFFSAAATTMRRILVEEARRHRSLKAGGKMRRLSIRDLNLSSEGTSFVDVIALDEALSELEKKDARKHQVVMLRYFAGLDISETAELLGVSSATVDRDWSYARAWLLAKIEEQTPQR